MEGKLVGLILNNWLAIGGLTWGALLTLILLYIFLCPNKAKKVASWFYYGLAKLLRKFRKHYIAYDLEGRINDSTNKLDEEAPDIAPLEAKIQWITSEDVEEKSFRNNDEVILVMDHYQNQNKNFVNAVNLFSQKAVIPKARHYLEKDLARSIDLTVSKRIIREQKSQAMDYFVSDIYQPELKEKDGMVQYCKIMEDLENSGFFTRVLLDQLQSLRTDLYPDKIESPIPLEETKRFTLFLENLATKEIHEDVKLQFDEGRYINIGITLIARDRKIRERKFEPYIESITTHVTAGAEIIYLIAYGRNANHAKNIAEEATKRIAQINGVTRDEDVYKGIFLGEKMKIRCIPLKVSPVDN